jgi:curved DNA-binding protein
MEYRDYYKILGVPKTATEKEIKAAYRRLARKHHPDVNQGNREAEARFKEINEANEVLSDPEKRRRYDQLGSDWASYQQQAGQGWGGFPGSFRVHTRGGDVEDLGGFSDFFKTFFGGGAEDFFSRGRARGPAPVDTEVQVELTLEEVLHGAKRHLSISGGRRVDVKIPAGVREGSRVRVAGEGGGTEGGPRGDLYLRMHVVEHPVFRREGDDLSASVAVPLTLLVLGGETEVPTLEGPVGIKVPAGTPPDRQFRLRAKGLPRLEARGERGDLHLSLRPEIPRELRPRERELFEELRRLGK